MTVCGCGPLMEWHNVQGILHNFPKMARIGSSNIHDSAQDSAGIEAGCIKTSVFNDTL